MKDLSYIQKKIKKNIKNKQFFCLPSQNKTLLICIFILIFLIKRLNKRNICYTSSSSSSSSSSCDTSSLCSSTSSCSTSCTSISSCSSKFTKKINNSKFFKNLKNKYLKKNNKNFFECILSNVINHNQNNNNKILDIFQSNNTISLQNTKIIQEIQNTHQNHEKKFNEVFESLKNINNQFQNLQENIYSNQYKNLISSNNNIYNLNKPNIFENPNKFNNECIDYMIRNDFLLNHQTIYKNNIDFMENNIKNINLNENIIEFEKKNN